jgi:MYXO-CTERM domain-containing protein
VGTTVWTGFTPIGSPGIAGQYGGSSTLAQLLTAPGFNQPESNLVPQTPIDTFRTGNAVGFVALSTVTASNVGLDAPGTVEMVVWDNSSGQYPTWKEAFAAWTEGSIAAGESGRWNATFGGIAYVPPFLDGLKSFNLYYLIPEPSCLALAALGLAALVVFRRRKS